MSMLTIAIRITIDLGLKNIKKCLLLVLAHFYLKSLNAF
ncbi:hypothetical protein bpSLO_001504 (plasmid) [Borrelia parkeri]|nr:hypothetical protein bpSLO_001504 [Borrelia parkeri]